MLLPAAIALLLSACGSAPASPAGAAAPRTGASSTSAPASASTPTATPPPPSPTPPPPCRPESPTGTSRLTLVSGGVTRQYLLTVPVPSGGRLPIVLSLHGYGQSAQQQDAYTRLPAAARAAGVLLVTPEGASHRWNFIRRAAVGPDDVLFLRTLIAHVAADQCGDPQRVVLTGISDGADMADTLGCAMGSAVSWVIAVAPSISPQPCDNPPNRVLEIHGQQDRVVPFAGGGGDRPAPFEGTEAQPVTSRLGRWAVLLGCTNPRDSQIRSDIDRTSWTCAHGHQLDLLTVSDGGHTWPGAAPWPALGGTTTALDAARLVVTAASGPPSAVDGYLRQP